MFFVLLFFEFVLPNYIFFCKHVFEHVSFTVLRIMVMLAVYGLCQEGPAVACIMISCLKS